MAAHSPEHTDNTAVMALPITFGTSGRISGLLDPAILDRFLNLDQGGKISAEYVWIGGTGSDLRSKTKSLSKVPKSVEDLPVWNYDGSSTGQAPGGLIPPLTFWALLLSAFVMRRQTCKMYAALSAGPESFPLPGHQASRLAMAMAGHRLPGNKTVSSTSSS